MLSWVDEPAPVARHRGRTIALTVNLVFIFGALAFAGCGDEATPDAGADAGPSDAGTVDGGHDAAVERDAGHDAGRDGGLDAGGLDGGAPMTVTFPARDFTCVASEATPCETLTAARSEAERTVLVTRDMPATTLTYVIGTFSSPQASFAGTAPGLNLDATDSGSGSTAIDANCEEFNRDFRTVRDPEQVGVDNALEGLLGTLEGLLDTADCPGGATGCLDAQFTREINEGRMLLLVEITGVESFANDEQVQVALYAGSVVGGGLPALGDDDRLAPGQTFETVSTLLPPTPGDIFETRLRVRWTEGFVLPLASTVLLLPDIDEPELRANVSAAGLELGVVGATTTIDPVVARASAIMPGIADTIRSILEAVADIGPTADPAVCERLSTGYLVDAVPALRR